MDKRIAVSRNLQAGTGYEMQELQIRNVELMAALQDATFLLRKIGKFPGDLPQMMDSITRCVQDCRAVIEKEQA